MWSFDCCCSAMDYVVVPWTNPFLIVLEKWTQVCEHPFVLVPQTLYMYFYTYVFIHLSDGFMFSNCHFNTHGHFRCVPWVSCPWSKQVLAPCSPQLSITFGRIWQTFQCESFSVNIPSGLTEMVKNTAAFGFVFSGSAFSDHFCL